MGTIKGQNLRICINGFCVGASTSCSVHLATQSQDISSKDTPSAWADNVITGLSWDVSVDAFVINDEKATTTQVFPVVAPDGTTESFDIDGTDYYPLWSANQSQAYLDTPGLDAVITASIQGDDYSGNIVAFKADAPNFYADNIEVLATGSGGTLEFENDAFDPDMPYILFGMDDTSQDYREMDSLTVDIEQPGAHTADEIIDMMENKTPVSVYFSLTEGTFNRDIIENLMQGTAIVSDISVNAANRQPATYSVQLTGASDLILNTN